MSSKLKVPMTRVKTPIQKITRGRSRTLLVFLLVLILIFVPQSTNRLYRDSHYYQNLGITVDSELLQQELQLKHLNHDEIDVEMGQIFNSALGDEEESPSHSFWNSIFKIFDEGRLNTSEDISSAIKYVDKVKQKKGPVETKETLLSKAIISDSVLTELQDKHRQIVRDLPTKLAESTYIKNSKGVVIIGGKKYSWLAYLSLLALRETGSRLPVEVIMPTKKDYEQEFDFCNKVLPTLDAKCIVLPDVLGRVVMKGRLFSNFQFKSLALAVSSFENILMLDSDNIPITNPDSFFDSKLYKYYGMITWPDYWKRTISPKFYELADIEVNEEKRVRYGPFPLYAPASENANIEHDINSTPYHDLQGTIADMSTEAGQLIINKRTHGKTILLALFYNLYGPGLFYKLFSLGEQGEGDKDTYVAAATVSKQTYYQVRSTISTLGYHDNNNRYHGVAMGQKDPVFDYDMFLKLVHEPMMSQMKEMNDDQQQSTMKTIKEQIEYLDNLKSLRFHQNNDNPIFTIHCNFPKLDPKEYMTNQDLYDPGKSKLKYRVYGDFKYPKYITKNGNHELGQVDFEFEQWSRIHDILCVKRIPFVYFEKTNADELCLFITNQVNWLGIK